MLTKINNWYLCTLIRKTIKMVHRWRWNLPPVVHWRLNCNNATDSAGEVQYDSNTIILSSFLINEPPKAVINILLHELAHLSVYHDYHVTGHGKQWQRLIQDANCKTGLQISKYVDIEDLPVLYKKLNSN